MNNNENIEQCKKHFFKFVEFIGKDNNIPNPMSTPYYSQLFSITEKEKLDEEIKQEWKQQYLGEFFIPDGIRSFKDTKREDRKERCGECAFFGDKGCTTSYIEAKWGNKNTPACSEFSPKIFGTKATFIFIDDPLKES